MLPTSRPVVNPNISRINRMDVTKVLRVMQDGIEFFVVEETGESAVSIRGLARMCGVRLNAIQYLLKTLDQQTAPKMLESLHGQDIYLTTKIVRKGKEVVPIRSKIASAIIRYYDRQGNETAQASTDAFAEIGFESYVQGVVGYLPSQYTESTLEARHQITRLIREPNPWKRLYSAEMCGKIRRWYFPKNFFWKFAYSWMTQDEIDFLDAHNPVIDGIWQRENRIFQHLSEETRDRLAPEIAALCTLVESSTGRQDFETRWNQIHGADQQELLHG
jgi:hypothetical protein